MRNTEDKLEYKIVDVNDANIDEYGLFCFKSKKNTEGYKKKIEWAKKHFKKGLRIKFLLVNEGPRRGFRSRGFIEYIPGEYTWRGISAKGYMVIHCVWVVGKNRKHGYGSKLLELCLNDAEGMNGVAVVTSGSTWLPGKGLFLKHGFEKVDTMPPNFELLTKRFKANAPLPKFNPIRQKRLEKYASGITILKSDQCPYTSGNARIVEEIAMRAGVPVRIEHIENCKEAQNSVHPYGTFCVLLNGKVLSYRPIGRKELHECLAKME